MLRRQLPWQPKTLTGCQLLARADIKTPRSTQRKENMQGDRETDRKRERGKKEKRRRDGIRRTCDDVYLYREAPKDLKRPNILVQHLQST